MGVGQGGQGGIVALPQQVRGAYILIDRGKISRHRQKICLELQILGAYTIQGLAGDWAGDGITVQR